MSFLQTMCKHLFQDLKLSSTFETNFLHFDTKMKDNENILFINYVSYYYKKPVQTVEIYTVHIRK